MILEAQTRRKKTGGHCVRVAVIFMALVSATPLVLSHSERVIAQDATDASSVACKPESAISTAPLPAPAGTPVASPVANVIEATGEPADPAVAAEIELVVRTLAACTSEGRSENVAKLATENYLGALYGGGQKLSKADYLALAPDLPAVSTAVSAVSDVRTDGTGASADVTTVVGNQLERGRWTFVRRNSRSLNAMAWRVDTITPLPVDVPATASDVAIELKKNKFVLGQREVTGPNVVLGGANKDTEDHEILVLRLGRGTTTDSLLLEPGPGLPDGIEFVGQVTVPAGESADLALVGLPAGNYAVVCLLPDQDGTPHLALGMQARFKVK